MSLEWADVDSDPLVSGTEAIDSSRSSEFVALNVRSLVDAPRLEKNLSFPTVCCSKGEYRSPGGSTGCPGGGLPGREAGSISAAISEDNSGTYVVIFNSFSATNARSL